MFFLWMHSFQFPISFFFQMNMDVSPYEAGLDFFIKLNKVINVSLTISKKYFLLVIARLILV